MLRFTAIGCIAALTAIGSGADPTCTSCITIEKEQWTCVNERLSDLQKLESQPGSLELSVCREKKKKRVTLGVGAVRFQPLDAGATSNSFLARGTASDSWVIKNPGLGCLLDSADQISTAFGEGGTKLVTVSYSPCDLTLG